MAGSLKNNIANIMTTKKIVTIYFFFDTFIDSVDRYNLHRIYEFLYTTQKYFIILSKTCLVFFPFRFNVSCKEKSA